MENITISTTNTKGQVVIPKDVRDSLGITPQTPLNIVLRGEGVYLYPVREVLTSERGSVPYAEILKKTQGAWGRDPLEVVSERKRRKFELKASQRSKKGW